MAQNKRVNGARALVGKKEAYSLDEAMALLGEYSKEFKAKFDESVEVVFKLGVDPKHSDQVVRGVVAMPHGLGKDVRVAVFTKDERRAEALEAGADLVGSEDLVDKVKGGEIGFDACIATPDFMPKLAVLGKVLGTRGLMPNPKLGTVSDNIKVAVKAIKFGQVEYKVEKAGLVHAGIGKLSFTADALKENLMALYNSVIIAKPTAAKGVYMQKICIGTSQGPSLMLDLKGLLS